MIDRKSSSLSNSIKKFPWLIDYFEFFLKKIDVPFWRVGKKKFAVGGIRTRAPRRESNFKLDALDRSATTATYENFNKLSLYPFYLLSKLVHVYMAAVPETS